MISRILFFIGAVCLGLYGWFQIEAWYQQKRLEGQLERTIEQQSYEPAPVPRETRTAARTLQEGDLVGRLEIPRLDVSVMVMEGVGSRTLRLGAGRIPGTGLPWTGGNIGIAGHRDTFFRPLAGIQPNDTIRFTTVDGTAEYRVTSATVVGPKATHVLRSTSHETLTLITCYPFYWVGPAPKRFIVQASKY
jgi:sortase A